MNMLVVFLLVVLGCSPAEGVSKCELKELVLQELQKLQDESLAIEPKVVTTRIVCHAEKSSNFNTSAVNTQGSDGGSKSNRTKRNMDTDMLEMTESGDTTTVKPRNTTQKWTFYGIFQLGNLLVCRDKVSTNPKICNYDCNKLIDADVTNDIRCLTDIIRKLLNDGFHQNARFMEMVRLIYEPECDGYVYSEYFKECQ